MYFNSMFLNPSVIFYSHILNEIGGYPYKYRRAAQDYAFFFKIIKRYKAENYPEILLDYVTSNSSISSVKRKLQVYHRIRIILDNFDNFSISSVIIIELSHIIWSLTEQYLLNQNYIDESYFRQYIYCFIFSSLFFVSFYW